MASLEDFLRYGTTTQVNATRAQPQRPAVLRQRDVLNDLYSKNLATGTVSKPEPGGIKGFLGDIIESPIGKAVLGAANVLDVGRRTIISTIKEAKDALDGDPNTSASWNELTQQIKDPTFGFGDVTGNLFGESGVGMFFNRVIGFAGDVVLDPLTHITLGASRAARFGDDLARTVVKESGEQVFQQGKKTVTKAAAGKRGLSVGGQEGRLALGRRLAKMGADDATVASAVRYGRPGVKDVDMLNKSGIDRAGLYFMGKRIAGTTRVGEALESGLSKSRVWFGDHIFSKPAKLFTAGDAEDARRALARGNAAPGEATEFMLFVLSRNAERSSEALAKREATQLRNELLGTLAREDIDLARGSAYKLMDYSDAASKATGATADERVASAARGFLDNLIGRVKKSMTDLDPEAPIGEVDFYFPHFPKDDAYRWMANSANADAVRTRELFYNPLENAGAYKNRMQEGDEFFGVPLTKDDIAGGVDRLNEIARNSGKIDFDFFETDLPTVLDRYIDMYSKQQGRIARKKFLADEGVYKKLEQRFGPDSELLTKASRVVNRRVKARDKSLKATNDIANNMLDEIDKAARGLAWFNSQAIEEGVDAARATVRGRFELKNTIRKTSNMLDEMLGKMSAHQAAYDGLFSGEVPMVIRMLQRDYDDVMERIRILQSRYKTNAPPLDAMQQEIKELQSLVYELTTKEANLRTNSLNLQYYINDVIEGIDSGVTKKQAASIRTAIFGKTQVKGGRDVRIGGRQAQPMNEDLWNSLKEEIGSKIKGKWTKQHEDTLVKRYTAAGGEWGNANAGAQGTGWWYRATRRSPISASKVENMATDKGISNTVARSIGGEADLTELRTAALALLAISDHMPEEIANKLKAVLEVADEADNFYAQLAGTARDNNGRIVLEQLLDNWERQQVKIADSVRGWFQAGKMLDSGLGIENLDPNDLFPDDLLRRIVAQSEGSPIGRLLGEFLPDDIVSIEDLAGMTYKLDPAEIGESMVTFGKSVDGAASAIDDVTERAVRDKQLTVGEFIDIMSRYRDEVYNSTFELQAVGKRVGEPDLVQTTKIRMSEILEPSGLTTGTKRIADMDSIDEVEDFISQFVTGKGRRTATQQVAELAERIGKSPAVAKVGSLRDRFMVFQQRGKTAAYLDLEKIPGVSDEFKAFLADPKMTYASIGEDLEIVKQVISQQLVELQTTANMGRVQGASVRSLVPMEQAGDELRIALRDVDEAISSVRSIQVPARSKGGGARVLTGQVEDRTTSSLVDKVDELRAAIDQQYGNVSVSDASYNWSRQASENEVRAARRDVAAGRGGSKGVKTAKAGAKQKLARQSTDAVKVELGDALREAWFFSEVETRFQRVADALFKVGLVPDKDLYRAIVNTVARDKGQMLVRERQLYGDAANVMKGLLDDIGSPEAWVGREKELYDTIIRTINPGGMGGEGAEWSAILSRISGRADAQRLRQKAIYLGNNSGVANKRRQLRSAMNKKNISAEERIALKAEFDALPSAAAINAERRRFLDNELRPWYRANVDSTVEKPSMEQIRAALDPLSKVKSGGGRLSDDADVSARELFSWVKDASERLDDGYRATVGKIGWLYDAADPYFMANNFEDVLLAGQELPSMYANSLMRIAEQYETAAKNFGVLQDKATAASAKLEEALPAERAALDKKRALEATPGSKAPSLKQVAVDEAERKALEAARRVQRQLVELKSSDDWFAAVERNSLNDLIKLFANYSVDGDFNFVTRVPSHSNAQELFNKGTEVYIRTGSGESAQFNKVTDIKAIVENGTYFYKAMDGNEERFFQVKPSEERVLRWRDGEGGIFSLSKFELESLFIDSKEFASARLSERAKFDNSIKQLDRQIIRVESQILEAERAIKGSGFVGDPMVQRAELSRLEDNLNVLRSRRESMKFTSYDREGQSVAAARNAALEKLSGLLQLMKRGDYSLEEIKSGLDYMSRRSSYKMSVVHEAKSSSRLKYLDDAWRGSDEEILIGKVRELEFSEQAALFNAHMAKTDEVLATVARIREEATKAWKHTSEDGAPYGKGGFDVAKYNAAIRAGKTPEEARVAAYKMRNISEGVVYEGDRAIATGRNVQEARAIVSGIEETVRKQLADIERATDGVYEATARFNMLISYGMTPTAAARKIYDEVRALRPKGEALFVSSSFQKNMARVEMAQQRIGFLSETMDKGKQWFWSPEGLGQEMQALQLQVDNLAKMLGEERLSHQIWVDTEATRIAGEAARDRFIPGIGGVPEMEATLLDAAKLLKQSDTYMEDARVWYKWTKPMLERRVQKAEVILNGNARVDYGGSIRKGGISATEDGRADLMNWVDQMITTLDSMGEDVDVLTALRADYLNAQSVLVNDEKLANLALRQLADLKDLKWGAKVVDDMEDGLVRLSKAGMPSYYASKRIAEMSVNMQRMRQPEFVRGLNRFMGRYTGYFKAGAVGTPGFVVRNTMSNTFSLVSAGADPRNMTRGLGFFMDWRRAVREGNELAWVNSLAEGERELVSTAIKAMDASGYGRAEEALVGWAPKRKWLTDNAYYRKVRKWNEASEQSARFILAYDVASKGASFDEAVAQVKRYLFDYVDVSSADVAIRSVVPFWFWMSRNLPLQIINQWTHPRAYAIYNSFKRNFGKDDEGQVIPSWLAESGAISLGGRYYLNPDLPMSRIQQQASELIDPKRLLRYVNPGLRVPFEVMLADKRLSNDIPFRDKSQSPVGGPLSPAVQALAQVLGQGKVNPYTGERGVSDKMNYAMMSLFPQLGQLERSVPSTDLYKDRQLNSLRSILGIPIVNVTDEMIQSELRRRGYEN